MKLLITGGLGHIGSRLLRDSGDASWEKIIVVDNLSTQRYSSLFDLPMHGKLVFLEEDILTVELDPLLRDVAAVLHLAAVTDAERSVDMGDRVHRVNYEGTRRVAAACAAAGVPMIFPSTTSVYGTQADAVDESCADDELKPQSPYAESKFAAEKMLASMRKEHGLDHIVLRLGTIVGASTGMRFHTAVNKFIWQAVNGIPITVWRTALHQKRPYLALDDAARLFRFVVERKLFDGGIYNAVTRNMTVNDIVERIREDIPGLKTEFVDSRIMNQLSYEVKADRIRARGFEFRGDISASIGETLELLRGLISP